MEKITVTREEFARVLRQEFYKKFDEFCTTTPDGQAVPTVLEAIVGSSIIRFCFEYKKKIFKRDADEAEIDSETLKDAGLSAVTDTFSTHKNHNLELEGLAVMILAAGITNDMEEHYFGKEED